MALGSCTTSRWTTNSPQIKLLVDVNKSKSDGDTAVIDWELQYISSSPANTSVSKSYTVKIAGATVKTGYYDIDGKTGTKTIASGSKSIARGTSSKTVYFSCSMDINITWSGSYKGTISASSYITIDPKTSYTVTFNANGGTGAPAKQTKWHNKTLTLSKTVPKRDGYTFVGWGLKKDDTSWTFKAGGTYSRNASNTLYALWKKTIQLTYNANGGTGAPTTVQKATVWNATEEKQFTISTVEPTKSGAKFKGWALSSAAIDGTYGYVDTNNDKSTITLQKSATLYAVWGKQEYKVAYNTNGGKGTLAAQTKKHNETLKLHPDIPERTSTGDSNTITQYTFKGWSESSTATKVDYKAGANYTKNSNVTLYAVWSSSTTDNSFTISYNTNGGSEVISQIKTKGEPLTLRDEIPIKNGYTFRGWALSAETENVYGGLDAESINKGEAVWNTDDDTVLYAVWQPWHHEVKFSKNGGSGTPPESFTSVTGVDKMIPENTLTKANCTFKYWCTNSQGYGGTNYYTGDGYTGLKDGGDVTLYAIWSKNLISFKNDGTICATELSEFVE